MAYGIPKSQGGDSPENVAKMERCVKHIKSTHKGMDEGMCIAICKHSIFGPKDDEKPDLMPEKDDDEDED